MSSGGAHQRRRPMRAAVALLSVAALAPAAATAASAASPPSPALYRAQRLCEARRPGEASCEGIRLLAKSLTSADLRSDAARQTRETAVGASPAVTNKTPPGGGLGPEELHLAYALPDQTFTGTTQTIAVIDAYNDPTAEADLGVYDKYYGLPACTKGNGCFNKVNQSGKASPLPSSNGEWAVEESLDVDMAHAICQSCHVLLVEANNEEFEPLGTAVDTAVRMGAAEISNSYAGVEESYVTSANAAYDHPGVVITASSGDCGYRDEACGGGASNFPAGSPDVIAVGGTALSGSGESWTSTVWEDGGSDCATVFTAQLWQQDVAHFSETGCGTARASADVAADADPWTGVEVYDSTPAGNGDPTGWIILGGTSASSPIVASEFGLAGGAHGVEYPAATLYSNIGNATDLTDVVSGHNGSCTKTICKAASGYDGPTGVGSPHGLGAFATAGSPVESALPTLSGTAEQGQALGVSHGTWTNSPTSYAEQWLECSSSGTSCAEIKGATGSSYTLLAGNVGKTIRVQEIATNGTASGSPAVSAASAAVISDAPVISSFTPTTGLTGATVKITGTAFTGATKVRFDNLSATFAVRSSTEIEATVPNGTAAGKVSVTTAVATGSSAAKFTPTFSLVSFSPQRATANSTVLITGVGFTKSAEVFFDGTRAEATWASPTKLKAIVPSEAGSGPITVENGLAPSGVVASDASFTVTTE
jgi:subtilase family serine protease